MLSPKPETLSELVVLELQGIALLVVFSVVAGYLLRRTFRTMFGDEFIDGRASQ